MLNWVLIPSFGVLERGHYLKKQRVSIDILHLNNLKKWFRGLKKVHGS